MWIRKKDLANEKEQKEQFLAKLEAEFEATEEKDLAFWQTRLKQLQAGKDFLDVDSLCKEVLRFAILVKDDDGGLNLTSSQEMEEQEELAYDVLRIWWSLNPGLPAFCQVFVAVRPFRTILLSSLAERRERTFRDILIGRSKRPLDREDLEALKTIPLELRDLFVARLWNKYKHSGYFLLFAMGYVPSFRDMAAKEGLKLDWNIGWCRWILRQDIPQHTKEQYASKLIGAKGCVSSDLCLVLEQVPSLQRKAEKELFNSKLTNDDLLKLLEFGSEKAQNRALEMLMARRPLRRKDLFFFIDRADDLGLVLWAGEQLLAKKYADSQTALAAEDLARIYVLVEPLRPQVRAALFAAVSELDARYLRLLWQSARSDDKGLFARQMTEVGVSLTEAKSNPPAGIDERNQRCAWVLQRFDLFLTDGAVVDSSLNDRSSVKWFLYGASPSFRADRGMRFCPPDAEE